MKPAYEIHRTISIQGVVAEGRYEYRKDAPNLKPYWVLREWRLIVDGDEGTWHRVHGNRKKDFGALKLLREHPPTINSDYPPVNKTPLNLSSGKA